MRSLGVALRRVRPGPVTIDAHNVDKMLARKREQLREDLHAVLMELYIMHLRSEGRSVNTQYTALYRVFKYLHWLEERGKRIDCATALDVKAFLAGFEVEASRHRIAAVLKGFYRFLMEHFGELREILASRGVEVSVDAAFFEKVYRGFKARPPKNYPLPEIPKNLREKVERMIDHADQPYKAILAIIYETGARRGEVLNLKVGDVEDVGDYIRLKIRKSKSKPRVVAVVRYQNVVRDWLRRHAQRDDPDAPLFYTRTGRQVMASNLYMYIFRLRKRLGIKERIYEHGLGDYRATELCGKLSEKEMMQWFGWDTRYMIDIYSHLKETAAVEKILAIHGIGGGDGKGVETVECPRCGTRNPADTGYRYRCGSPITIESAIDRERKVEEAKYIIDELVELAMENPELLRNF